MALWGEMRDDQSRRARFLEQVVQQALLVPEAVVLLGILLLAWALHFPPWLGLLAMVCALFFGVRMALMALAARFLAQGAYARADRVAQVVLQLNPWSTDALVLRAQGLTQHGEDEAAEQILRRATTLYPHDRTLQRALATTILSQGRITEGWKITNVHAVGEPNTPQAAQQRAWLALHVEDNAAKARLLIMDANPARLSPRVGLPLFVTLAEAQILLDLLDEAQRTLKTIETQLDACSKAQQAELLYHLGRLHSALGQDGTSYFRRSVERDPAGRYAQIAWRSAVNAAA